MVIDNTLYILYGVETLEVERNELESFIYDYSLKKIRPFAEI